MLKFDNLSKYLTIQLTLYSKNDILGCYDEEGRKPKLVTKNIENRIIKIILIQPKSADAVGWREKGREKCLEYLQFHMHMYIQEMEV